MKTSYLNTIFIICVVRNKYSKLSDYFKSNLNILKSIKTANVQAFFVLQSQYWPSTFRPYGKGS